MKSLPLIFISLFITISTLFAQESKQIMPRHALQQQFLIKELSNRKKLSINKTDQLDSLFIALKTTWMSFVKDSLISYNSSYSAEAFNNLDAYSYNLVFRSIKGQAEQKNIEHHLYKNYMLPSIIKDLNIYNEDQSLNNLKLIWRGSLDNLLYLGVKYYDHTDISRNFYAFYTDLRKTLLPLSNLGSEKSIYAKKLLNTLIGFEYEIETKKHYFSNQQDISFTYLITGLSTNKYYKPDAVIFADTLIRYYHSIGEQDKCIAIMNNLFLNTSNDILPRDTLRKWYRFIDIKNGDNLFDETRNKFSSNDFQALEENTIRLPEILNFVTDTISQKKIRKANYILIDFWYTACPPCINELSDLNEFYALLKSRDDIVFISINADYYTTKKDKSNVYSFAKKFNIEFPIIYDNEQTKFIKQFNVYGYPTKFILNTKGQIITKKDKSNITLSTFYDFVKIK